MSGPSIMFIVGDVSGDHHAASIVKRLKGDYPDAQLWGIGGPAMQENGFISLMPFEPFNRMGFIEVISHLPFFLEAKRFLIRRLKELRPDCVVCVDYPGFNMPMMKAASREGIPVVWYIAPMVWAWKKKRARVLAQHASHIACIFPFEPAYFAPFTENSTFVGNPLVESMDLLSERSENISSPVLAIIPGSRRQEIEKMLYPMVETYSLLKKEFPALRGILSRCSVLPETVFTKALSGSGIELFSGPLQELLQKADLALVKSGTATLETALSGVPQVIAYKTSQISYSIFKRVIKIPFIGLPNIIAGEQIVPECIQDEMSAECMAAKLQSFLLDKTLYCNTRERLMRLREQLGSQKPSEVVSDIIMRSIKNRNLNQGVTINH